MASFDNILLLFIAINLATLHGLSISCIGLWPYGLIQYQNRGDRICSFLQKTQFYPFDHQGAITSIVLYCGQDRAYALPEMTASMAALN
jgi:hypothetical protein